MAAPCEECIKGTLHNGQPVGKIEKVYGLDTYVTGDRTNARGVVVLYSDIFGIPLPNNRLLADAYAKSGEWLVYMPDFFEGDPMPLSVADILIPADAAKQSTFAKYGGMLASAPSFVMWLMRHKEPHTNKVCMDFMESLRRATPRTQKIGMVGTCWGGRYALRAARERNMIEIDGKKVPLVDAVVVLHPSNLSLQEDVENPVVPFSAGWGVEDQGVNFAQKAQVEEIHAKERQEGRKLPEIEHKVYRPGRHGFSIRGNPDDPQERKCLEDSQAQVLDWFQRWL